MRILVDGCWVDRDILYTFYWKNIYIYSQRGIWDLDLKDAKSRPGVKAYETSMCKRNYIAPSL